MPVNSIISAQQRKAWHEGMLYWKHRGRTHQQIADTLGCSLSYVYKTLPKLLDKEAVRLAELSKREIVYQLGAMDVLLSEVRVEWEKSCGPRKETITKNEGAGVIGRNGQAEPNGRFKQSTADTVTEGTGDPRLIEQIRAILADKRRLLRLDKDDNLQTILQSFQINIAVPGQDGGPMVAFTPMAPAALAETAQLMAAYGMNPDGTPAKRLPDPDVIEAEFKDSKFTAEDAKAEAAKSVLHAPEPSQEPEAAHVGH